MLFNCERFSTSFNAGYCAFKAVCSESNCPFVLMEIKEQFESLKEIEKDLEEEYDHYYGKAKDLEDERNNLEEENEKKEDEINKLNEQIENLIKYIQKHYDEDFTCTLKILAGAE